MEHLKIHSGATYDISMIFVFKKANCEYLATVHSFTSEGENLLVSVPFKAFCYAVNTLQMLIAFLPFYTKFLSRCIVISPDCIKIDQHSYSGFSDFSANG